MNILQAKDALCDAFLRVPEEACCADLLMCLVANDPAYFVVENDERIVGIVSIVDVALNRDLRLCDVVMPDSQFSVKTSTSLIEVAEWFERTGLNAAVVFDELQQFVGIVTGASINAVLAKHLVRLQDQLHVSESESRAKSDFLAQFSHEIRTPLTSIFGCADLLARQLVEPNQTELVQTIRRSGKFLIALLNDILDFSKIAAGRLEVTNGPVEIAKLLAEVDSLMRYRAEGKGIQLRMKFGPAVPASVETDPNRLRQILTNLVANAISYTDEGSVTLLTTFDATDHPAVLRFDIVDTGIGIPSDELESLFVPFHQPSVSDRWSRGGTGLGLPTCHRLAELLGGKIEVKSKPASGSTFSLILCPTKWMVLDAVLRKDETENMDENQIASTSPAVGYRLNGKRILLVDDRHENLYVAQRLLELEGATVQLAENGELAIAQIDAATHAERPFDVVVMDMQMPVMDGYTAARRLTAKGNRIPIVALTAGAGNDDRKDCIGSGCSGYLTKPIDANSLTNMIAELCQSVPDQSQYARASSFTV